LFERGPVPVDLGRRRLAARIATVVVAHSAALPVLVILTTWCDGIGAMVASALLVGAFWLLATGETSAPRTFLGFLLSVAIYFVPGWNVTANIVTAWLGRPLVSVAAIALVTIAVMFNLGLAYVSAVDAIHRLRTRTAAHDESTGTLLALGLLLVVDGTAARLAAEAQHWHDSALPVPATVVLVGTVLISWALVSERSRMRFLKRAYGGAHPSYEVTTELDPMPPLAPFVTTRAPLDAVLVARGPFVGDGPHRSARGRVEIALLPRGIADALAPARALRARAIVLFVVAAGFNVLGVSDVPALAHLANEHARVPPQPLKLEPPERPPTPPPPPSPSRWITTFPRSCRHGAVHFVDLGPSRIPSWRLADDFLMGGLETRFEGRVTVREGAFDRDRGRLVGDLLVAQVRRTLPVLPRGDTVIAILDKEMVAGRGDSELGLVARDRNIVVLSFAGMGTSSYDGGDRYRLLRKLVTRMIAFVHCGERPNSNPRSVLFEHVHSVDDLLPIDSSIW